MGREVITSIDVTNAKTAAAAAGSLAGGTPTIPTADEYSDRLVKYIPAEVVGVYLFANGTLHAASGQISATATAVAGWIIFGFMAAMTPVYMGRVQHVKKKQQLLIVFFSFVVWVFTIGGPFVGLGWYRPIWGALLLPLYTFSIAIVGVKK